MRGNTILILIVVVVLILAATFSCQGERVMDKKSHAKDRINTWKIHDPDRPQPSVVKSGPSRPPVPPPSDAVVLFDGT